MESDTGGWVMSRSFKSNLIVYSLTIILISVLLNSLFSSFFILRKYDDYLDTFQERRVNELIEVLKEDYSKKGIWDESILDTIKKFKIASDFTIELIDSKNNIVLRIAPQSSLFDRHGMMNINQKTVVKEIYLDENYIGKISVSYAKYAGLGENAFIFEKGIRSTIILSSLIVTLIVIFLSLAFEKKFTKPLKELSNSFSVISKGNYDTKIGTDYKISELNTLKDSVNMMASDLKSQSDLRNQLTSDISHELKTPITIISGTLEALEDGLMQFDESSSKVIRNELSRINAMVNQIQYLTDLENLDISLNVELCNLKDLGQFALDSFKSILESEGIQAKTALHDVTAPIDWDKMVQVVYNLVENAVKAMKGSEIKEIKLSTRSEGDKSIIEVSDTGCGISEQDINRIYERFYKADYSRNSKNGGSGIGLAIVKEIVSKHGGTIEVSSSVGNGSTFKITLETDS